nr:hypothetical protein [Tanacetum cinerariifolium]
MLDIRGLLLFLGPEDSGDEWELLLTGFDGKKWRKGEEKGGTARGGKYYGLCEKSLSSWKSHDTGASYVMVMSTVFMKEGMSALRGRKFVPGMNSSERENGKKYYSAFTRAT